MPIVALGASAGGLESLQQFFNEMPDTTGMAFVLVQHLAPDHESLTPSLLARHTAMPAAAVVAATEIAADCIYVIAPDTELTLAHGRLEVGARSGDAGHWRPIDRCFASLAEARGTDAVAVILSGTGTDGTDGAREIAANGGLVIAQHPDSAAFAGMPEHAIDAGVVNHVLAVEDMPARIIEHLQADADAQPLRDGTQRDVEAHLPELLALVKTRAQFDLSEYRPGTPIRRIARRMAFCKIERAADYLDHLKAHPGELDLLVQDLFIGVTRFFRDPAAFEYLEEHVIPALIRAKPADGSLRLWVAGCASGEEVYSLAILISEALTAAGKRLDVRILATDINEEALANARRGQYTAMAVSALTGKRRQNYFKARSAGYQIRREIREWVTFARHDLLSDPAFAALDLIACRNVLIYFATPIQGRVLDVLHHALNPGGYLWLGQAENLGAQAPQFEAVSREAHLFRRIGASAPQAPVSSADEQPVAAAAKPETGAVPRARTVVGDVARHMLLEDYAPASVVIDRQHDILHFQGDTQAYLNFPSGEATLNLQLMARRGLRGKIASVVRQAGEHDKLVAVKAAFNHDGARRPVRITARPLRWADLPAGLLLVSFSDLPIDAAVANASDMAADDEPLVAQLEYELQITQHESQQHIQRLEDANAETGAVNEELQATNEELEASKEELQALNEELQTVNADLQEKFRELDAVRNDWRNLLVSTDIATVFLDRELNVRRFTPAIQRLFHLIDSDQGRPLSDIVSRFGDGEALATDARAVIATLAPGAREVVSTDGRWYDRRIQPYRAHNDAVDGVVVTFVDVTERKRAAQQIDAARAHAEHIVETLHEAVLVLDDKLRVISANSAFYAIFELLKAETENRSIFELGARQWDIGRLRKRLEALLADNSSFAGLEVTHEFPGAGERVLLLNARRLDDVEEGSSARILLAMTDISHQKRRAKRALASSEDRYRVLFEAIPMLCFTVAGSGRIRSANHCAEQTLGFEEAALSDRDFVDLHPEDAQQVRDRLADTFRQPATAQRWETRIQCAGADMRWVRETACVVGNDSARATVLILCEDITDERRLPKLAYHANHDPLTGLLNRREFERRANQLIENAISEDQTHVMGFIDLDQFKIVNDTGGHLAGDAVLRQVAQMLRARMRAGDTIARLGGDEFGLLIGHCDIAGAESLAGQLLDDMQALRAASEQEVLPVGMSIGLAAITAASTDLTEVLRAADAACYQAKVEGRHRSYVYQTRDEALTQRHGEFTWISRATRALEDKRLRLVYQSIVPMAVALEADAGAAVHFCELLLRLIEPHGRVVPAAEFMPAVERYGLVSRLDQWVIATAFDWLRDHPLIAERLTICAINLSAQSLNDEQCVRLLHTRLTDGSVAPGRICLEITETAVIQHWDRALHAIEALQALGCHFALDDFGSGLASFAYLKTLPADFLKIDGALMPGLADNAVNLAMVTSINEIAHLMGKQTVAEGIEDRSVLAKLQEIGVDYVQGYALSMPTALEGFV